MTERNLFYEQFERQSSGDYVEVVRCKDCKYRIMDEPGMVYCENILASWVSEDFYCADGERGTE